MIIVLTQCFPPRIGGIENLISNLVLQLSEKEKIIVFADQQHVFNDTIYDQSVKDKFHVRRISGLKFFRRRKKIRELEPILMSNEIKCVIGDTWKSFELSIDLINKQNIPTICLAHGNEIIYKDNKHFLRIKETLNKVSAIVCNSDYTKKLINNYDLNKPILKTIYPGACNYLEIKEVPVPGVGGDPILLTLARLEKRKGHKEIIYSISKLKNDFPNIKYIIAGSGRELKNLKKLVSDLNLNNTVIFVDNVNDAQKKYLFKKTKLMIMPTLDETSNRSIEGFGISYLEAAFFRIPSIASNIGGTPEAVINNKTGIIIDDIKLLHSSIKQLLIDEQKITNLGMNAEKRAISSFLWEKIVKQYISLIYELHQSR